MNYDSVILELLSRVQELERKMKEIEERDAVNDVYEESVEKISTDDIYDHIICQKNRARECGDDFIIIRAGDVEKEVGIKNRITMVVNAMKKAILPGDEIVSTTPSGFSTTYEIKYFLNNNYKEDSIMVADNVFLLKKANSPKTMHEIRELKVETGKEYIMVFNSEHQCVGVVFEHYEKRGSTANYQAEICFFDEFYSRYGKWHRMFIGGRKGERIMFSKLENILRDNDFYKYQAEITSK